MDVSALSQIIKSNPILATGAGLGVGGTLFASLKQVPATLFDLGKRQVMTTVNITSGDFSYRKFQEWMYENGFAERTRTSRRRRSIDQAHRPGISRS